MSFQITILNAYQNAINAMSITIKLVFTRFEVRSEISIASKRIGDSRDGLEFLHDIYTETLLINIHYMERVVFIFAL